MISLVLGAPAAHEATAHHENHTLTVLATDNFTRPSHPGLTPKLTNIEDDRLLLLTADLMKLQWTHLKAVHMIVIEILGGEIIPSPRPTLWLS